MTPSLPEIKHRLDIRLGRLVYGNLSSFSLNFKGRRNLRRLRAQADTAKFINAIDRDGFYRLPHPIPPQVVGAVAEAYRSALSDPERSTVIMSPRAKQDQLPCYCRSVVLAHLPELRWLITREADELIRAFFGGPPAVMIACARRNEHMPADIAREYDVYSNSWHCDGERSDRLKMFVALDDISDANGPLHWLNRSRTRRMLESGFDRREHYGIPVDRLEDEKHLVKFTGPIGSVIFVNVTQCLHRAGVPSDGQYRDIAEFQFRVKE